MKKPYRIMNAIELEQIKKQCSEVIQSWRETYCLYPLDFIMTPPEKGKRPEMMYPIQQNNSPVAFIEKSALSFTNWVLFGEDLPAFNECSKELLFLFIQSLFSNENCLMKEEETVLPDWFYPGSTSLILTLFSHGKTLDLIISPEWVHNKLPQKNNKESLSPGSLDEALDQITIQLSLQLAPMTIPLEQLIHLQKGDLLVTDHSLLNPIQIVHTHQPIAEAELGSSASHKSIILTRCL